MGHAHDHGTAMGRAGARHAGRLRAALLLSLGFLVIEVVAAFITGSLALLSDAAHQFTDTIGIGLALAAIGLANRAGANPSRTFGLYRLEVLAALTNAVLLLGVAGYVLVESVLRLTDETEVEAGPMFFVALAGVAVNLICFFLLRSGARESMNVEGAYLEVLADLLGSIAVVVAAVVIGTTGWEAADPIAAALIGLWVVPRTLKLARTALRVLLQSAPPDIDVEQLRTDLAALDGVVDVHDLHVWTLTSEMDVATAHLMVRAGDDGHAVLDAARDLLRERYSIAHATLQVEPDDHAGCAEVEW
jgi:cobalt-zinc-cadmium efflux system protein